MSVSPSLRANASSERRAKARNVSTQISLWLPNYLIYSADKFKHSNRKKAMLSPKVVLGFEMIKVHANNRIKVLVIACDIL